MLVGIGHKFNDFIQAVHRVQRFGQPQPVEIDIVYSEADRAIRRDLEAKWAQHEEMAARMSEIIRKYGLNADAMAEVLTRSIGLERLEASGQGWRMVNNDCVVEAKTMATASVDLIVTSIPFANHYEYTPSYNDFGHTEDNARFFAQADHLTPELLRILKPGRLACIHVKDRVLFGSVTGEGVPTIDPFHAECIFHYRRHGLQFMGMMHVNTDVVRENNQTYRLGYTEMRKDGTKMGVGCPEYVLLFRKQQTNRGKGYADVPVVKDEAEYSLARWQIDAHAFWRSSGDRLLSPDEMAALPDATRGRVFTAETLRRIYDFEYHVRVGEALEVSGKMPTTYMALALGATDAGTWHDVQRMRTLNTAQASAGREKHMCTLQFDIVDRLITRFSMSGERVFDPFAGIGTVPLRAMKLNREGWGAELSHDYWRDACGYLRAEEERLATPTLFDVIDQVLEAAE
ncbi:DNA methyltransferase [Lichenifustis flavocetrariae]|uniref:Methyltransferase n=1 Tax=Lichenifustis flavocetrariae TaxID=2949735 RepID=A0AA41Z2Q2_9HYPH|nr:DNA methyltransferase [Lichenifustis flavocetrariae]MCW6508202.1 site-specific DNA-methyltransferase [Lichenifustis flavocetrariae]